MAVFFMASYVEATAQSDVSLPVDVGGMEKYGYDFTGFSMDKESLLTMMDASIKGLNKAIKECEDEARKSELSGRVEALSRAYDVVSASDKERYFLTDEEGNLITGSGSLYKILGYMRGGVESLEIEADWDMTPREIVISGNGNSALVYYKDEKFYSDREAETEVFNVGDVGGRIVTSDSSEGHYKGVYLASGLELVDTDGNLIIDDDLSSAIEAELKLTAAADYYLHLQVIRSDGAGGSGDGNGSGGSGNGDVKEGPIDFYFYGDTLYHDLDYTDRADSIDIPSSGDEDGDGSGVNARTWKLIDMITDAFGESYIYSLVELKPVIGERVTEIEVIEPEDDSDDSDDSGSGDDADGAGGSEAGAGSDDSDDEELMPTIIVHTEDYLQGYVATNRDDSAIFVVSADGSIDYDNTDIDEENVDVDSIKEETLARWLEEKEAERRAAEEEEEAAAAASSGLSIEDAAAVASSDEAGIASSDESEEAGLAASEGASGPSDAANEGMSGDGAGTGDAIGDSAGTGAGNEDAAGSDQLGGDGNGDGNDDAIAGGNAGGDNNDDAIDNSGDDGNDDSGSGDDAGDSGDSGDDGDDDDGGDSGDDNDGDDGDSGFSEDAAPSEEYHGDVEASDNSDGDDDSE